MEIEDQYSRLCREIESQFHNALRRMARLEGRRVVQSTRDRLGEPVTREMLIQFEDHVPNMIEDALGDIFAELAYRLGVDQ